jgi:tRNA wybutosine-synthesizing protein 4
MNFVEKNFAYETKQFDAFIDEVGRGERVYLRSLSAEKPSDLPARLEDDFPSIASDFKLPSELALVKENMHSSPLRISSSVSMWLHYDVMANVLCQVKGEKRLLLFPPTDVKHFDFEPGSSSSRANVFNDLDKYRGCHPHEAFLKPGDILFLPALWLHAASPGEGMSISVNVFFRSLNSGYSTGRDVYGNRDLQAYEKGRQDIQKILKSFDGLPADVRGFYLQRLLTEFEGSAR